MAIPVAKQYIRDFEQLGFGLFIHFGLYSVIGHGEWIAHHREIQPAEYRKLMQSFRVDSMEEMVLEAKRAGAKYVTLTTRHHDGFSLYDTCGLNDYDAPHSAAGRDLVAEFVEACHKHDIVPFFYHTTLEFWHPDFQNNFPRYLQYLRESVKLLCTRYGKIGGLWFDGNWSKQGEGDVWEEDRLYRMIRQYQPDAMIINNTGLSRTGELGHPELDSVTFERGNPRPIDREGAPKYLTGEMCDSVNMHWGIADDYNYKAPKTLIEALCVCRKVGANYLLNVGPDAHAHIPPMPKALLGVMGEWMGKFGEAVYDGRPLFWEDGKKNFVLQSARDPRTLYFFCFDLCRKGSANVTYIGGGVGDYLFPGF